MFNGHHFEILEMFRFFLCKIIVYYEDGNQRDFSLLKHQETHFTLFGNSLACSIYFHCNFPAEFIQESQINSSKSQEMVLKLALDLVVKQLQLPLQWQLHFQCISFILAQKSLFFKPFFYYDFQKFPNKKGQPTI